ncbi:MAG: hypothetical protein CSA62_02035 [Planctomycetota bacterium]|nr:MAG: hypothetical protein CSA62_02035 [Planctomycetota bacterium]
MGVELDSRQERKLGDDADRKPRRAAAVLVVDQPDQSHEGLDVEAAPRGARSTQVERQRKLAQAPILCPQPKQR